jgi:thiol-disulfide isomerase/thioredoxin
MYIEKGSDVFVNINANEFYESITYTKELASENNYLAKKQLMDVTTLDVQRLYSENETTFLEAAQALQKKYDSLLTASKIKNNNFLEAERDELKYEYTTMLTNYEGYHKYFSNDNEFTVSNTYYDALNNINFKDTVAFRTSVTYQQMLNSHYGRLAEKEALGNESYNMTTDYLKKVDAGLPDGYAKNKLMAQYLSFGLRPDESLEEAYAIYKNSNPNIEDLATVTERYKQLLRLTKGQPSPTFDYENYKGGTTSLADLKGNYAYIDIWATWCGPCVAEFPALKQMEEDYGNKGIKFVSISIDTPEDYATWKQMITVRNLGGVQLMSDKNWQSQFIVDYAILGIPRFILVDPEGKIVTADAPRPSDPKLRVMLNKLI